MKSLRLAAIAVAITFQAGTALLVAAEPSAQLSRDRFTRLQLEAGRTVDAIGLLDPDESGPGFVAWVEGGDLRAGSPSDLKLTPASEGVPSPFVPGYIRGKLVITWAKNEIQRALYDLSKGSRFVFEDKKDALEFSCVLMPGSGSGGAASAEASYRVATAWRVKRSGKVLDSGSMVFLLPEGIETPISLQGSSQPAFAAKFLVSPK